MRMWGFLCVWTGVALSSGLLAAVAMARQASWLDEPDGRRLLATALWTAVTAVGVFVCRRTPVVGSWIIGIGAVLAGNAIVFGGYSGVFARDAEWRTGWLWAPALVLMIWGAVMLWPWHADGPQQESPQ